MFSDFTHVLPLSETDFVIGESFENKSENNCLCKLCMLICELSNWQARDTQRLLPETSSSSFENCRWGEQGITGRADLISSKPDQICVGSCTKTTI